jgi:hypothetical protein
MPNRSYAAELTDAERAAGFTRYEVVGRCVVATSVPGDLLIVKMTNTLTEATEYVLCDAILTSIAFVGRTLEDVAQCRSLFDVQGT